MVAEPCGSVEATREQLLEALAQEDNIKGKRDLAKVFGIRGDLQSDAADALAIAICHVHSQRGLVRLAGARSAPSAAPGTRSKPSLPCARRSSVACCSCCASSNSHWSGCDWLGVIRHALSH